MIVDSIHWIPYWLHAPALLVLLMLSIEIGHRVGLRQRLADPTGPDLGTMQAAVLGLLGLLLAFTYSYAAGRADNRKNFVREEANAIGTAYLRAGLVAEPARSDLRKILREYTDSRLMTQAVTRNPATMEQAIAHSEEILNQLWPAATQSLQGRTPNVLDALMIQSINEVIDMHGRRLAAWRDHVPGIILIMLLFTAVISMCLTGYSGGLRGQRSVFLTCMIAVLVSAITLVIFDLDDTRHGFIRISQQSLIDLQRDLNRDAESQPAKP